MKKLWILLILFSTVFFCAVVYSQVRERYIWPVKDRQYFVYEHKFDSDDFVWLSDNTVAIPAHDPNKIWFTDPNGNHTTDPNFIYDDPNNKLKIDYLTVYDGIDFDWLTASRLLATDGSKNLVSTNLSSWVTGTTNRITVTDDGDGTITLTAPQDLHTTATPTFSRYYVDGAGSYIDTDGSSNMTLTDAVVGTKTLKQLGSPTYLYIKATAQSEGDLHLSDGTNWGASKVMLLSVRIDTTSTNWDLWILQNDNGYAANDAVIPMYRRANAVNGDATLLMGMPYQDEDASNEVHLYYLDNSGANTADIYIFGHSLN